MDKTLKPFVPKPGDTIGLFAPAGPLPDSAVFHEGIELIQDLGFQVLYAPDILESTGYLAGSDERRRREFFSLWHDPEVTALLAIRGGYGCLRLLASLASDQLEPINKTLIGFSDLTVLLNGLPNIEGVATIHGPMLSTLVRDKSRHAAHFLTSLGELTASQHDQIKILRPGRAHGRLMGGNLSSLSHMIGTPFEPDWEGTIVILEDINEPAYKIDRMLTQLKLSGRLDQVSGLILGEFLTLNGEEIDALSSVFQRVLELTQDSVPVWASFPVGHGVHNSPLPIGVKSAMNDATKTLEFIESPFC